MDRRQVLEWTFAVPLVGMLANCGRESSALRADVPRSRPRADAPVERTVTGIGDFGHALARRIAAPDTNVVFSPLSIAYAFAMLRGGTGGETSDQIDEVFGFPPDGTHPAFNALTYDLVSTDDPPPVADPAEERGPDDPPRPPIVAIANQLFPNEGLELVDDYLELVGEHYGAELRAVDFTDTDAAEKVINDWVKEQTAGRIDKLFDELRPNTILVLANAIYLRADWAMPFIEEPYGSFTLASGENVEATMLFQNELEMPYAITERWQAVDIPYAGELVMRVVIPTDDTAPSELLAPDALAAVGAELTTGIVELTIPAWDFATELDLVDELEPLGLTAPFSPAEADLSGIFGGSGAWIGQAIHRANITVDQAGTEAAAVTGLGAEMSAPPQPEVTITADRPFAFAILATKSRAPLFVGQVADPTG